MVKREPPVELLCSLVPGGENRQHSQVNRLVIAVLVHVVGVHWTYGVVGTDTFGNHSVKLWLIAVLLLLDEVLNVRQIIKLDRKINLIVELVPGCEVVDQR